MRYVYVVTECYWDDDWDESYTRVLGVYRSEVVAEGVEMSEDGYMLHIDKVEVV